MYKNYKIRAPFFEIGPKCFMWGERMLRLALEIDRIAEEFDLDVIVTPQYTDIRMIAENTKHIHVYAQHMDSLAPGRGRRFGPARSREGGGSRRSYAQPCREKADA